MSQIADAAGRLSLGELHELTRWSTPTIYNGWEQITAHDAAADGFNLDPVTDFMPHLGPVAGYAVTVLIEGSNPRHRAARPDAPIEYYRHVADLPGPKIVVVQDLDSPRSVGSFWGEVNASIHRALGCVGTITDGAVRDLNEMTAVGFKTLARRLCVGHAHAFPVRWGCEVEVFGRRIQPGQLIHADQHGFLTIPREDEPRLLEAARFMDHQECQHLIPLARHAAGRSPQQIVDAVQEGINAFSKAVRERFARQAEFQTSRT